MFLKTINSFHRTFSEGQLKMSAGDLLPKLNTDNGDEFAAGDVRVLENPGLSSLHSLFVREHNRIASSFYEAGISSSDEELYQLARR